jgi:DNA-binding transcriptional LysR family regulator
MVFSRGFGNNALNRPLTYAVLNEPNGGSLDGTSMDALLKLKAFLSTAETGSFSDAARKSNVSPSVIMKRINELELDFRVTLFHRSTRHLALTDAGQRYLLHARQLVQDYEDMRSGRVLAPSTLEGPIRIRAPVVATLRSLGRVFSTFRHENPGVVLDVTLTERPGNPIEEGFDIAIGLDSLSYEGVVEEMMHPYPRVICAAPGYLQQHGRPGHPHDLTGHPCLTFVWAGPVWSFKGPRGLINVDVHPVATANNGEYLRAIACDGHGIVQLALPTAAEALRGGQLVTVLRDFPLAERWMKLMVPQSRMQSARVQELARRVRAECAAVAPWDK